MTTRRSLARLAVAALLATPLVALGAVGPTPPPAGAVTGPPAINVPDPDTVPVQNPINGHLVYGTYGTTVRGVDRCGSVTPSHTPEDPIRDWLVPAVLHGSTSSISLTGQCADADALEGQYNAMVAAGIEPGADIWAPTVSWYGGKYIMHYTAKRLGSGNPGQRCLYRATSPYPWGPFTGHDEFSCPGNGRWALDADSFVEGGNLYVVFRDDNQATNGDMSAIGVFRADSNGYFVPGTYRLLFKSDTVSWDYIAAEGKDIIENPSVLKVGDGRFYLFFSGHAWNDANGRYATGVADCGTSIASGGQCALQPMDAGFNPTNNPYFGWSSRSPAEFKQLPGDYKNPGGMSLFRTHAGGARVVWHADVFFRTALIEILCFSNDRFTVSNGC